MLNNKNVMIEDLLLAVEQHYGFVAGGSQGREVLGAHLTGILESREFEAAIHAEVKHVTILLSDIRGFTAITETYAARLVMDMLNRYFALMSRIILSYGGTIDKFMGDSIMVLFGAPGSRSDDVERAIACAVEMQQAMNEFNQQNLSMGLPEIYIGIGINSGEVMAGDVGSELHREYTVIGDEVNLVSRIEAQSLRGQILLSENTFSLACEYIEVGVPNLVRVKGKRDEVNLYELLSTDRPRMMTVPRRETRKSPRVNIRMPVNFQILDGKTVLEQVHRGEVIDLGYNGMQALLPMGLPLGTEIRILMSLQLFGSDSTEMYARILKVQAEHDGYRTGTEFTFVDTQGQQAIKQFVDSMVFNA